jgi:Zn finger protein HypA/HybF involved in hydrogenase expression
MPQRNVDQTRLDEDWEGNNIAVTCPACGKVFIVSEMIHQGKRECPKCGKSTAMIQGGRKSGGTASVSW